MRDGGFLRAEVPSSLAVTTAKFTAVSTLTHRDPLSMRKMKKAKSPESILVAVKAEMAVPRTSKSAKIAALNIDSARIPEQPRTTVSGTVDKIIPPERPKQAEKAELSVDGADAPHRALRIENTLTDENGDEVALKKGAHVSITVTESNSFADGPKRRGRTRGDISGAERA